MNQLENFQAAFFIITISSISAEKSSGLVLVWFVVCLLVCLFFKKYCRFSSDYLRIPIKHTS